MRLPLELLCVVALVGSACAPGLTITRRVPPTVDLGVQTGRVAVVTDGEPGAAAMVQQALERELRSTGAISVVPLCGPEHPCGPIDAWVRAMVMVAVTTAPSWKEKPDPEITVQTQLRFDVIRADGALLAHRQHAETRSAQLERDKTSVLALSQSALEEPVRDFVRELVPRRIEETLELDDTGLLKPVVKLAVDGDLAGAEAGFTALVTQNPRLPGAHYDLGVLAEVRGDFDAAEQLYAKAVSLSDRSLYADALAAMHARLADQQRMRGR